MTNKKKKAKVKKIKQIIPYTVEERDEQINQLKIKLAIVGISQVTNNIEEIKNAFFDFIEHGKEYDNTIKLNGTHYILTMKLINNVKKPAEIFLKHTNNV